MRRRNFLIPIIAVAIFFVGFYNKPIGDYFNTVNTFIGLLFSIIIIMLFYIFDLQNKKKTITNSYNYYDAQNNVLRNEIEFLRKKVEDKDNYIKQIFEIYNKK